MIKLPKKAYPKDPNQLAKFIVDLATGEGNENKQLPEPQPAKKKKSTKK